MLWPVLLMLGCQGSVPRCLLSDKQQHPPPISLSLTKKETHYLKYTNILEKRIWKNWGWWFFVNKWYIYFHKKHVVNQESVYYHTNRKNVHFIYSFISILIKLQCYNHVSPVYMKYTQTKCYHMITSLLGNQEGRKKQPNVQTAKPTHLTRSCLTSAWSSSGTSNLLLSVIEISVFPSCVCNIFFISSSSGRSVPVGGQSNDNLRVQYFKPTFFSGKQHCNFFSWSDLLLPFISIMMQ